MSFILDALKKSELERQRQNAPGLVHSAITGPRARLPAWVIAVCVLLAVNLIILSVVLVRGRMAPPPALRADAGQTSPTSIPLPRSSPAGDPTPGGASAAPFSPLDAAPVYAPEIPVAATAPAPPPLVAKAASHRRDPLLTDPDHKADDEEVLPTINEINLTGSQALPELHLDVHVYATRPAERFVYVNMRKYHEGAVLQEGPTVEHIRRDGVVLNYHALRFLLPRQ
ncbi:MAG: general secretion pathway protein GspB [Pseudomonadota bacterium]|nr:general secretion pathway protein GspB [Pseudomonadota bacterium]